MKDWLEKYFGFTQREIRGLCVFIIVMVVLLVFPTILSWIKPNDQELITAKDESEIYEFVYATQSTQKENPAYLDNPNSRSDIEYFEFNPNKMNPQQGARLGLTERQIRMIQNYISKGGSFYRKEDFKKIYA